MFLFLSIYFGSYYRQIVRSPHLSIEILDLDSLASPQGSAHPAILGPAVREQVQTALSGGLPTLGYYIADDSSAQRFQITQGGQGIDAFEYAMAKVDNQDVWGVMIINANATSGVWNAITSGAQWTRESPLSWCHDIYRKQRLTDSWGSNHIHHFRIKKLLRCRTIRPPLR